MTRVRVALIGAALSLSATETLAQAFTVDITVGGVTQTRTFSGIESALTLLEGNGIRTVFPGYTSGTPLTANVNLVGLTVPVTVPAGTTTAVIAVPGTNQAVAFQGQTGGQTQSLLREYFRGTAETGDPISALPPEVRAQLPLEVQNSVRASLTNILQTAVARTFYDPVAGNPTALLPTMAASDFSAGTFPAFGGLPGIGERRADGLTFSLGVTGSTTTSGPFDVSSITVPLRIGYNFGATGTEVFLDGSVAGYDTDGTRYYQGTVGFGVRQRVLSSPNFDWHLTPVIRWGIAGSDDLGRGSAAFGGGVTSDLRFALPSNFTLGIGNSISYYHTQTAKFGNTRIDYDLGNTFFRNGASISRPIGEIAGRGVYAGISFVDTRTAGDRTAVSSWQEYSAFLGMSGSVPARLTATYIDGRNGFSAFRGGLALAF